MRIQRRTIAAAAALAVMLLAGKAAQAQVATIYGVYDAEDGINTLPPSVLTQAGIDNTFGNTPEYDTPSLFFVNPSGYSIVDAQMILFDNLLVNNGQNTLNLLQPAQTVPLGTLSGNAITQVSWGSGGQFFTYDYDDEYSSNYGAGIPGNSGSFAADCTLNAPDQQPEWTNFCAPIGNFEVEFSGTLFGAGPLDGQAVAAVFAEYDVDGNYVGWEGVDPNGWSENLDYDVHSGTVSGVLANIDLGSVTTVPGSPLSSAPEPSTLALFAPGLLGVWAIRRRRKA